MLEQVSVALRVCMCLYFDELWLAGFKPASQQKIYKFIYFIPPHFTHSICIAASDGGSKLGLII